MGVDTQAETQTPSAFVATFPWGVEVWEEIMIPPSCENNYQECGFLN
jgi:hypothetical protein